MQISTIEPQRSVIAELDDDLAIADEVTSLKQCPPFRYVDEIFEGPPDANRLLGWVNLEASEHRYYSPALRNVILIEALAQLSGILLRRVTGLHFGGVLTGVENANFGPDEPIGKGVLLYVRLSGESMPHFKLECEARQGGRSWCSCTLSIRLGEGPEQ